MAGSYSAKGSWERGWASVMRTNFLTSWESGMIDHIISNTGFFLSIDIYSRFRRKYLRPLQDGKGARRF